jgi:hypothetical protein
MRQTTKTWTQLTSEMEAVFARWHRSYILESILTGSQASKERQTFSERSVILQFTLRGAPISLQMARSERAVDNLALLIQVVETLRMNEVRRIDDVMRDVYRKAYPESSPASASGVDIPEPYHILGVLPSAPWEVIEAAYRAQVRIRHPDVGGSNASMQEINAAMEEIRRDRSM